MGGQNYGPKTLKEAESLHDGGIPFHKAVAGDPAGYEHMRDDFMHKGMSKKAAQKKAAMIWNSKHKGGETVGRGRR